MSSSAVQNGWVETTLGEVAEFQRGFDLPTKDRTDGQYPLMVSNGQDGTHNEFKVKGPGIVTGRSGTIGSVFYVEEDFWPLNTTLWVKDFHGNDVKFVYYFLKTFPFGKYNAGSGVPTLNRNHIHQVSVKIPPLPEQRAIAAVLSSLDDKIELLREQNKTLEAMTQELFREWFTEFNFPDADGKPYKKSGGKMIDGELGEIPEEWRVGRIGDVVEIRGGSTPSTQNPDFWDGEIAWTSPKDLSNSSEVFLLKTEKRITNEGLKQISSSLLPKGTLLLSSRAPIGYLAICELDVAINQGYIAFLPNQQFSNNFMYIWLKMNMQAVINASNGSTFLEISKSSFRNINCVIPSPSVIEQFNGIIQPFFGKNLANLLQIKNLTTLRDELLPKLMKGKVD